ncbi:hypothetical protein TrST_g1916 [Triparma strigata]|uniref:Uncharacterized protein n=3 Tax=Triparma TaxID=722752 RepID=A0A9W7AMJ9_9STRA|nr:hypothetical protein TrST_g1916 [Triparma strigata]GMH89831.1 hypothetical protein TL16_g11579 [Triparma laevis f. inornata]GMH99630.1 hypothetical protein TrLO_g5920 [Triparma laevis f. longispina]
MALLAAILAMGIGVHDASMFPFFSTLKASEPPSSSTMATAYGLPEVQQGDEANVMNKGHEAASMPPTSSTLATAYSLSNVQQGDEMNLTEKGHKAAYGLSEA